MKLQDVRPAVLIAAMLLLAAFAIGLAPVLRSLHGNWTAIYGDLAHGYLLLVMALILAWKARESPYCRVVAPWWPAMVLLLPVMMLAAMFGELGVGLLSKGLIPVALFLVVAATGGVRLAWVFAGSITLLYFGLPVWWLINGPLQSLTAAVANLFVHVTGLPAHVEGNVFHLPGGVVEVASGCSGLNYLLVGLTLAWYQGQLHLRDNRNRARMLLVATVLSLVCNWVRVSALVWVGYISNMQHYLIRVDHLYFGWVLFLLVIWPLVLYGVRLERREEAAASRPAASPAWQPMSPGARSFALPVVLVGLILLSPAAARLALSAVAARQVPPQLIQTTTAASNGHALGTGSLVPGAEEQRQRVLVDGQPVDYFSAFVPRMAADAAFPESAAQLLGRRWQPDSARAVAEDPAGRLFEQQEGFVHGQRYLMRSGLLVAGYPAVAGRSSKITALRGLARLRSDWQLWVALVPCQQTCEAAGILMNSFLAESKLGLPERQ